MMHRSRFYYVPASSKSQFRSVYIQIGTYASFYAIINSFYIIFLNACFGAYLWIDSP